MHMERRNTVTTKTIFGDPMHLVITCVVLALVSGCKPARVLRTQLTRLPRKLHEEGNLFALVVLVDQ